MKRNWILRRNNSLRRTLECERFKLAYFPVPKTASTSMKRAFYKLEYGEDYAKHPQYGKKAGIHSNFFGAREFYNLDHERYRSYTRIAVIREPARRIISAYNHRVVQLKELGPERIDLNLAKALGVEPDPTRKQFLCNLEKYRILSKSIRHHTDPFTRFLGHDLDYFTDVVRIGKLDDLATQISGLTGQEFDIGHFHKNARSEEHLGMGRKASKSLLNYCAGDYALMKRYFSIPPALLK